MKLPATTIIPTDKVTLYLLVPQARGDKSGMTEHLSRVTKFVTLLSGKQKPG